MKSFRIRLSVAAVLGVLVLGFLVYRGARLAGPDFGAYAAGAERKEAFFDYFLPIINERNREVDATRKQILQWRAGRDSLGWWAGWRLRRLAADYRMEDFDPQSEADWNTLLRRVDTVPPSLALAQAASESAWGTSRFAREGANYFGQWCYARGCGLVPKRRDAEKDHEVAVFDSPTASVESYMRNLNSHDAYALLRDIRAKLRAGGEAVTGLALAAGLGGYSERGSEYIDELKALIRGNDLAGFDSQ